MKPGTAGNSCFGLAAQRTAYPDVHASSTILQLLRYSMIKKYDYMSLFLANLPTFWKPTERFYLTAKQGLKKKTSFFC